MTKMTKLQKSLSELKVDDVCIITYKNQHLISLIVILHRIDFNHSSVKEYYFKVEKIEDKQ